MKRLLRLVEADAETEAVKLNMVVETTSNSEARSGMGAERDSRGLIAGMTAAVSAAWDRSRTCGEETRRVTKDMGSSGAGEATGQGPGR